MNLQRIPGFESTAYAYQGGRIVWAGLDAATDHPRNAYRPWEPGCQPLLLDATQLPTGAALCLNLFSPTETDPLQAKGLINWLMGLPMPFPLDRATTRFDAVREALNQEDLEAFTDAALRLIGLGHGLTPSGDDFVGGVVFTLHHLRIPGGGQPWLEPLPQAACRIHLAAQTQTNVISAALLDDLLNGRSYRCLHDLLLALNTGNVATIRQATVGLLGLGASSGADLLAGVLLAAQSTRRRH